MEGALHRFIRLLRLRGMRISTAEAVDAFAAAAAVEVGDRASLEAALGAALLKDWRDAEVFADTFARFFSLRAVTETADGHSHAHDDLVDEGELTRMTWSQEPGGEPEQGHSHGKPMDIRDYFRPEDLTQQYNLHQEANKVDLASLTQQIVLSSEPVGNADGQEKVQVEVGRLHDPGLPGDLVRAGGTQLDVELSVAQQQALRDWLAHPVDDLDPEVAEALRRQLAGVIDDLPELLKAHLQKLAEMTDLAIEERELRAAPVQRVTEAERARIEESLRRLATSLHGGLTHKKRRTPRGRVDVSRTMRANMKYDGVPFRPVTTRLAEDKPRLVVVADVSLSVRTTARFTLHVVHALQDLFAQVRTFAFVDDVVEITDLFDEHPLEHALGLVFGGDVIDVDATSDYGTVFATLAREHSGAFTRRTTLLVLGDGRGNGNAPRLDVFADLARRVRETIWLTPEPRYSWALGGCDLPAYADSCDRVEVIRDMAALEGFATDVVTRAVR
ncbi:VWA domain-containing protein [Klenkia sp. PcliD-1-E]|uniref:VWA domain-containing protein n=1 Tax=Klenkia sp. PcliD-1-E TaxID=2954492 RepID=UPI002096CC61|nr:VWA domain-containing protein [Klenkia sp. PcliD-1-E]MCO7221239.1 VWA domain-containing protein [Klenkia sp. PcliD-1-E]